MDPYRLFFPLGVIYALIGAALWILAAAGWIPYPNVLHQMLMIQGFEQCFVTGFLLTALPGLTHSSRVTRGEMGTAFLALVLFGAFAIAGLRLAAHACYLVSIAAIAIAGGRRVLRATEKPAEELVFVALAFLFAATGASLLALQAAGVVLDLPPRFAERLLSLGTVLSLVLGVGALIVPVFIGMRDPLAIPGLAGAHERAPRRPLYTTMALLLAGSFVLDLFALPRLGFLARAIAATTVMLLVWKLYRLPGRRDLPAFSMWGSGWFVLAGLWLAVVYPPLAIAALHVVFLGGFGLLTLAIGTRVVIAHGRHGLPAERVVFTSAVAAAVLVTLLLRVSADVFAAHATFLYGASAFAWILGWGAWAVRAIPRIVTVQASGRLITP